MKRQATEFGAEVGSLMGRLSHHPSPEEAAKIRARLAAIAAARAKARKTMGSLEDVQAFEDSMAEISGIKGGYRR